MSNMNNANDKSRNKINYNNEYNKKNYVQIKIQTKPEFKTEIQVYCQKHKISVAGFMQRACKYCIDNEIFKE